MYIGVVEDLQYLYLISVSGLFTALLQKMSGKDIPVYLQ